MQNKRKNITLIVAVGHRTRWYELQYYLIMKVFTTSIFISVIAVGTATLCCSRWNTLTDCVCIVHQDLTCTVSVVLDCPFHYLVQSKDVKYKNKPKAIFLDMCNNICLCVIVSFGRKSGRQRSCSCEKADVSAEPFRRIFESQRDN